MTSLATRHVEEESRDRDTVVVHVNRQAVLVPAPTATGLEIKQAAIKDGVKIQPDFVLSLEEGYGRTRIIGHDERVHVTTESMFLAVAPDDNS